MIDLLTCRTCDKFEQGCELELGRCGGKKSKYFNKPRIPDAVRCDQHQNYPERKKHE